MVKRIIRKAELAKMLAISKSTIDNRKNMKSEHYDPTFPLPFPLGPNPNGSKGWDLEEINSWIDGRKKQRDGAVKCDQQDH